MWKKIITNNCFMVKYVFRYTPHLIVSIVLLKILLGISAFFSNVYILKVLVDAYESHRNLKDVFLAVLFFILLNLGSLTFQALYDELYLPKQRLILASKMEKDLYKKAMQMELENYENPKYYDSFIWAISQSETKVLQILECMGILIESLVFIFGTAMVVWSYDASGFIFVLLSCMMRLFVTGKANQYTYQQDVQVKELQRKRDYTNRIFYQADYAKELRLSHVKDKLLQDFQESNKQLIMVIQSFAKKFVVLDLINFIFSRTILMNTIYMILLIYKAIVLRTISYGAVVALLRSVQNLQRNFFGIADQVPNLKQYSMYAGKFKSFLDAEFRENGTLPILMPLNAELALNNVFFHYFNEPNNALTNINMRIRAGEKIALVGANGAGKSTLIKLLLNLYQPTDGIIKYGTHDINAYKVKDYRRQFQVVFQDFKIYAASVAENVEMDLFDGNVKQVKLALEKAVLKDKIEKEDEGINSQLTKEFCQDGLILSGGETQRLAIARTFCGQPSIIIMDEPSSALDPIAEAQLNQMMLQQFQGQTLILISHRLAGVQFMDQIYFMENGRIVEEGTHQELLQKNGKYARMFQIQAKRYLRKK